MPLPHVIPQQNYSTMHSEVTGKWTVNSDRIIVLFTLIRQVSDANKIKKDDLEFNAQLFM